VESTINIPSRGKGQANKVRSLSDKGPFMATKYFFPNLKKADGKIANISAGFGTISSEYTPFYIHFLFVEQSIRVKD
jgi:hypothetical protein